jgi:hypothetical protein
MDATNGVPDFDPRRDAVACAALLLAMVISGICVAFVIDFEASASPLPQPQLETPARCMARGVAII